MVRHRSAKPSTAVRIRSRPQTKSPFLKGLFYAADVQQVTAEKIRGVKTLAFLFSSLSFLIYLGIVYGSIKRENEARHNQLSNQNILSKLKHYLETIRTSDHTL